MYKIEIKGSPEDLQRISTFLDNNHIKHKVIEDTEQRNALEEIHENIDWPF